MPDVAGRPLTVLITRRVRPGREDEFTELTRRLLEAARRFPGHLGGDVLRPEGPESPLYQTIFAFDDRAHLEAWTDSPERREILERLAEISEGETAMRVLSGFETWFALPAAATRVPPPRWKMAIVTWIGIFPLVLILSHTLTPVLAPFGTTLAVLAVTGCVTVAMTWAVMPLLVRLLARWLYPGL